MLTMRPLQIIDSVGRVRQSKEGRIGTGGRTKGLGRAAVEVPFGLPLNVNSLVANRLFSSPNKWIKAL
jgi:hypothetical protein